MSPGPGRRRGGLLWHRNFRLLWAGETVSGAGTVMARALLLSVLTAGVFSLLIPLTAAGSRAACYLAGSAGASAGIAVGNVVVGSFRQAYCPPSMLGRVTAGMRVLVFGGIPPGAPLAGWLATALGTRAALRVVLAGFALSGTLLLTPAMLSERCLPSTR